VEGRLRHAFERSLAWDTEGQHDFPSLVEIAFDSMQGSAGLDVPLPEPEDVLARADVQAQLDGSLKLSLMHALLRCSIQTIGPLARLETNLEWVTSILQTLDSPDLSLSGGIELADGMAQMLSTLSRGGESKDGESRGEQGEPRCLIEAGPQEKRRVVTVARLLLKGVALLRKQ